MELYNGQPTGDGRVKMTLTGASGDRVELLVDSADFSLLDSRHKRSFFKVCKKEALLEKIDLARNTDEIEAIAKKYYLCDVCELGELNLHGAIKLFKVVVELLYRYPMLRSRFCYIGSFSGYKKALAALKDRDREMVVAFGLQHLGSIESISHISKMTLGSLVDMNYVGGECMASAISAFGLLDAMVLNPQSFGGYDYVRMINSLRENERQGFHPVGCNTAESVIYHEAGHMLDYLASASADSALVALYNSLDKGRIEKELSGYAASSIAEFIAEAFSEFMTSERPRALSREVSKILSEAYERAYLS